MQTEKILRINVCEGKKHDFKLFKDSRICLKREVKIVVDSGYQGIDKIYSKSIIPKKNSKNHKLTKEEKEFNKTLSSQRIKVEHINSKIKRFKIISTKYRNKLKKFKLRISLICGIYNFEL